MDYICACQQHEKFLADESRGLCQRLWLHKLLVTRRGGGLKCVYECVCVCV